MKFNNYLNEDYSKEVEIIKNNCKPYLKFLKDSEWQYIFTRFDSVSGGKFELKTARKDRAPVDTPPKIHKMFDNLFYDRFGWKPRTEGVFTWCRELLDVSLEGNLFFPIGNFDFIWSPKVTDLYMAWRRFHDVRGERTPEATEKWARETIDTYKTMAEFDSSLKAYGKEFIFKCDKYYLCHFSRRTEYVEFLQNIMDRKS